MPWWIILVLVLAGGAVYLLRDKIKGLFGDESKSPYVAHPKTPTEPPNVPPPPPPPNVRVVPPLPVADAPIVRGDDAEGFVPQPSPGPFLDELEPPELSSDDFGGPIPRGFGDRFDGLLEVTLGQIQEYVPDFDSEATRYFLDPSLAGASVRIGGGFARVAPEALVSKRATIEAESIPVFSVSKHARDGASAQEIQKARLVFIEEMLKPTLTDAELDWMREQGGSMTGPEAVLRLARGRALAAMPDWLKATVDG